MDNSLNKPDSLLLQAQGISKSYGDRQVLSNVDLSVESGRIVTLIGPNGAGKTTLVRIALGLLQADKGSIYKAPGLKIGYMPQKLAIESTMPITVKRFLMLSGVHDQQQVKHLLQDLKISHLPTQQLRSISGGELQRVLLCRALLRKPDLLVLDEPAQGVDVTGQAELYALIDTIAEQYNCGILMISHDLHLVMSATDEVVCLNHHICCHGQPEHVSNDPSYLELFGSSAARSIAIYTHNHNHSHDIGGDVIGTKDSSDG